MPNRLADALSPYLLLHADDPVDWWEWGAEPFEVARRSDRPVFVSVGYASCHWCHVMARESFADPEVAEQLNRDFVAIKVDREERPDVDAAYMTALQALTGQGGWPMSVFCTPDGEPFFAGTYWPRGERAGMPAFPRVLEAVASAWAEDRTRVGRTATALTDAVRESQRLEPSDDPVDVGLAADAAGEAVRTYDEHHGGFGGQPKFPHAMLVDFLLAHHLRTGDTAAERAALGTLEAIRTGGIHDLPAGGFARYTTDARWLVPHFEKMLPDNALLTRAFCHAWQHTGDRLAREAVERTVGWMLADLRLACGALAGSRDADAGGEEGGHALWTRAELDEAIAAAGEDPADWHELLGVHAGPEVDGRHVLHEAAPRPDDPDHDARLLALLDHLDRWRAEHKPRPALDDKVLTGWNGLAVEALAEAGAALGRPDWVEAAGGIVAFVEQTMVVGGELHHVWRDGHEPAVTGLLEDHVLHARGLLALAEATGEAGWVERAADLVDRAEHRFADGSGGYLARDPRSADLFAVPTEAIDVAVPSGTSAMASCQLRLAALTGEAERRERAGRVIAALQHRAARQPLAHGELLGAVERLAQGPLEIAVVGRADEPGTGRLLEVVRERWRPGAVVASGEPGGGPALLDGRERVDGLPTAHVCRDHACDLPTVDPDRLRAQLTDAGAGVPPGEESVR